jgi:nitronate monooxygenase
MNTSDKVISTTALAWSSSMALEEYGAFLNQLLDAERAGARLLSAYLDELPQDSFKWKSIRAVQLDEARNCAVLIHLLLDADVKPTSATGDFHGRGMALQGWRERLQFLNRGQTWVAKRPVSAISHVPETARKPLQDMYDSHVANIRNCEALQNALQARDA